MNRIIFCVLALMPATLWAGGIGWSNPAELSSFINQQSYWLLIPAFYGLGLLLAFTPCVLPMVPILSGIIVGQQTNSAARGFRLSLAYVSGMAVTYAAAGMLAGWLGSTVQTLMQTPWVIFIFSLAFVLLGFNLLDMVRLPGLGGGMAPVSPGNSQKKKGFLSVAFMGVISTLVVSPCVTGPLIGILTYIGQSGQVAVGGLFLFILALGMGTPLLIMGSGYGRFLPKSGPWMLMIKKLFALMMFALAIWLLSRIIPPMLTTFLYAGLALISGLTLGLFKQASHTVERFGQGIGVIMLVLAGALTYQLVSLDTAKQAQSQNAPFLQVKTEQDLDRYLKTAKLSGQPVFVEFFASWCSDCQAMDKQVFNKGKVHQAMANSLNLRVDISQNDDRVKAMRKRFGVMGIPTMLFIDREGSVQKQLTAVGQVPMTTVVTNLFKINH